MNIEDIKKLKKISSEVKGGFCNAMKTSNNREAIVLQYIKKMQDEISSQLSEEVVFSTVGQKVISQYIMGVLNYFEEYVDRVVN